MPGTPAQQTGSRRIKRPSHHPPLRELDHLGYKTLFRKRKKEEKTEHYTIAMIHILGTVRVGGGGCEGCGSCENWLGWEGWGYYEGCEGCGDII